MSFPFYVIFCGRNHGITSSWDKCLKSTSRFKHNEFKSYPDRVQASISWLQRTHPSLKFDQSLLEETYDILSQAQRDLSSLPLPERPSPSPGQSRLLQFQAPTRPTPPPKKTARDGQFFAKLNRAVDAGWSHAQVNWVYRNLDNLRLGHPIEEAGTFPYWPLDLSWRPSDLEFLRTASSHLDTKATKPPPHRPLPEIFRTKVDLAISQRQTRIDTADQKPCVLGGYLLKNHGKRDPITLILEFFNFSLKDDKPTQILRADPPQQDTIKLVASFPPLDPASRKRPLPTSVREFPLDEWFPERISRPRTTTTPEPQ